MEQQILPFMPHFSPNLATRLLYLEGEDIESKDGQCSDVADMVLEVYDGELVWVDGDALDQYGWWYHAVPMVDGLIHDAWLEGWHQISEPLPLSEWLVKMFGTEDEIAVTLGGDEVYKGLPQNFAPVGWGLVKLTDK